MTAEEDTRFRLDLADRCDAAERELARRGRQLLGGEEEGVA